MTEQDFYRWLGERIRQMRSEAALTLREVCEKVGIYETDLSKFEKYGERIKGAYTINQIIMATGHEWRDLFDSEKKTVKLTLRSMASMPRPLTGSKVVSP